MKTNKWHTHLLTLLDLGPMPHTTHFVPEYKEHYEPMLVYKRSLYFGTEWYILVRHIAHLFLHEYNVRNTRTPSLR